MNGLFEILFTDGTKFVGNLFNKDWNKAPNKPIKMITFQYGKIVRMVDYEQYDLTMEMIGVFGMKTKIKMVRLVGRKLNSSDVVTFDFETGEMTKADAPKYKEYGNLGTSANWKLGINNQTPKCYNA